MRSYSFSFRLVLYQGHPKVWWVSYPAFNVYDADACNCQGLIKKEKKIFRTFETFCEALVYSLPEKKHLFCYEGRTIIKYIFENTQPQFAQSFLLLLQEF